MGAQWQNRMGVQLWVFQFQAPHERREPLKIAAHKVVAGHAVRVRPHAANHRGPPRTAVGDVVVERVRTVDAICNQGIQCRRFGGFQAVGPGPIDADDQNPRILGLAQHRSAGDQKKTGEGKVESVVHGQ